MVWPAANRQRGVADTTKKVGDVADPLVFETLKSDWEMFQPQGAAPSAWNAFTGANPCGARPSDLMTWFLPHLRSSAIWGRRGPNFTESSHSCIAFQNGKWVRYLTAFNQTEYTQIVNGKLYLLSSLQSASPVTFQSGALDVKSAWMDMTGIPDAQKSRYYARQAWVLDPTAPAGSPFTRSRWAWSVCMSFKKRQPDLSGFGPPSNRSK